MQQAQARLANCRSCGGTVSLRAARCPHCGEPAANDISGPMDHELTRFSPGLAIFLHFLTLGLFPFFRYALMHGSLPKVREDDPYGGKALGFMFIPFFNLYWCFFCYIRLCNRIAELRLYHRLPENKLMGLTITLQVMMLIPYVNLLAWLILWPVWIGLFQSSINELVEVSRTESMY